MTHKGEVTVMKTSMGRTLLAGLFLAAATGAALAQDYPKRPIRVVVAFPAGGSADIVARIVTQKVSEMSGYNFVVENRPGAGGNLAFGNVATSEADGYTLLFSTPGIAINPSLYRKVEYKLEDFKSIAVVGEAPLVLLARPSLGISSVSELVQAGKGQPDAIRFASSGNGSSSHLAAEVLRSMTGMQYLHVPYKGGSAAMTDVVGQRLDITMQPISESLPFIRSGGLRALGQTGGVRSPIAPDIPTLAEAGVKGYSVTTWYMLLGPARLPDDIVTALAGKFDQALRQPELREKLQSVGVSIINSGPKQASTFLRSEADKWAQAIKASGTRIE
ncbi:tripartite tricarboxylate transporter substrate binding protein [Cupriavidus oxalaticus]|nr:tripartite tricarboxylate transporter substrate binding protein [Cupriavidus oxalaticus]QRQ85953.1 tripartite tricarboxylate transporter substrate binding protein [Cupriavidus oxalaticus]WQD84389.1 tripartite tricarboxylate transporter substrate binding protein [Cupriavidus oxalaticus]